MNWPSERIPKGGVFHAAKANYNPETKQLLKMLVDESKMSAAQRTDHAYFLRDGQPFFPGNRPKVPRSRRPPPIIVRQGSPRRRTREEIVRSGAYDREQFVPKVSVEDREEAKRRLQEICEFGQPVKKCTEREIARKVAERLEEGTEENRFDELMREIQERRDWLKEMETLGEGHKYKQLIDLQIQDRMRQLEKLKAGKD